jgi:glycosyltransferase involved in cell wall biosynthesis
MAERDVGPGERPLQLEPLPARPLVSVLVANYNYAGYLGAALGSVLAQTYDRLEVLVCDDGSTDESCAIVESYAARDPRVKLSRKDNGGAASALNVAYRGSQGEIVCLLDADDTFEPTKLEAVVRAFGEQRCGLLVHPLLVVDGSGAAIQRKPAFGRFESGWIADRVLARGGRWSYMEASAVCMRRAVADLVFPIPEDLFRTWADAYLCSLGALLTTVGYVDETLARYRIHTANVSGFNSLSEDHGAKAMNGFERLVEGVNRQLTTLREDAPQLRVVDNLTYLESRLQHELLTTGSARTQMLRTYVNYTRRVLPDEIYGAARKALSIFFLGSAIALPRRTRARWLTLGLTHSRAKETLRRLAGSIRRLPRGTGFTRSEPCPAERDKPHLE